VWPRIDNKLAGLLFVLLLSPFARAEGNTEVLMYYNQELPECASVGLEFQRYAVHFQPLDFSIETKYLITRVVVSAMDIPPGTVLPLLVSNAHPRDYPDSSLYRDEVMFTSAEWDTFELSTPLAWEGDIWVQFIRTQYFIPFIMSEPEDSVYKRNWVEVSGVWGYENCDMAIGVVIETPTGIEENPPLIPSAFSLEQNYPNPFNPTTTIAFTLEKFSHAILTVYNLRGQLVDTVIDSPLGPGRTEVIWKGGASGIYFYVIRVDGVVLGKKKMLLLK